MNKQTWQRIKIPVQESKKDLPGYIRAFSQRMPLWLLQGVKFGLVGIVNTLVDLSAYYLLIHILGLFTEFPSYGKAISYSLGILNSYLLNRFWTFRSKSGFQKTFIPFFAVNLVGLLINSTTMYLCFKVLEIPEIIALALSTGASLLWNFLINKKVIFKY